VSLDSVTAPEKPPRGGVSVIIPVYNGALFIRGAIESVYSQTVPPTEVIVVNDASTDDTELLLRELETELPSSFTWLTQPTNSGCPAVPRNIGIARTTAEYVAFIDQDDRWHQTKLARHLEHFASDPDLALSFTGYIRIASDGEQVFQSDEWDPDPEVVLDKLLRSVVVGPPSTVLIRRAALLQVPPFVPTQGYDDWRMWLELAAAGFKIGHIREPLVDYGWHEDNLSNYPTSKYFDLACEIFDSFLTEPQIPASLRKRSSWWRARWHMLAAIDAIQAGDRKRSRRQILTAARLHPPSIRPGWLRMLGLGTPPS
jgi:teichuronic acid biosynthesis glycosyltransferase TuaG